MNKWIVGTAVAALMAIPAFALMPEGHDHHGRMAAPETRAEAEAKVKEKFAEIDADKDGTVTREEADAWRDQRQADMRDRMFKMMDTDGNGQISRAEFDAHHGPGGEHEGMGHHRGGGMGMGKGMGRMDLFARADADGDGKVTLSEATGKALEMFDKADANKDGTVTPEERRDAWRSHMQERMGEKKKDS